MAIKMKQIEYASTPGILAIPDHYVALAFKHAKATAGSTGLAVLREGRYVVKAGTLYPSNDANAIGVVLNDYDVTDGDQMMAVVIHGYIQTSKLPAVPTANAIGALKQIQFVPFGNILPELTVIKAEYAASEASGTEKTATIVSNVEFRPEAETVSNWTVTGATTNKVGLDSVVLSADKKIATLTFKATASTVAGDTSVLPNAACFSINKTVASAVVAATVA